MASPRDPSVHGAPNARIALSPCGPPRSLDLLAERTPIAVGGPVPGVAGLLAATSRRGGGSATLRCRPSGAVVSFGALERHALPARAGAACIDALRDCLSRDGFELVIGNLRHREARFDVEVRPCHDGSRADLRPAGLFAGARPPWAAALLWHLPDDLAALWRSAPPEAIEAACRHAEGDPGSALLERASDLALLAASRSDERAAALAARAASALAAAVADGDLEAAAPALQELGGTARGASSAASPARGAIGSPARRAARVVLERVHARLPPARRALVATLAGAPLQR